MSQLLPLRGFPNPTRSICYITSFIQCFLRCPLDLMIRTPPPESPCAQNDAYQALVQIQDNMTSDTDAAYSYAVNGDLFARLVTGDMEPTVANDTNDFARTMLGTLLDSCASNFNFTLAEYEVGAVTPAALLEILDVASVLNTPVTIIPISTVAKETARAKRQRMADAIPLPLEITSDATGVTHQLYAFIVHSGRNAKRGGHYVAYVNTGATWYRFDDAHVTVDLTPHELESVLSDRVATAFYIDRVHVPVRSFLPPREALLTPPTPPTCKPAPPPREIIEIEGGRVESRKRRRSRVSRRRRQSRVRSRPRRQTSSARGGGGGRRT